MTPQELIQMIRILSGLESWAFAQKERFPDYLHDDLHAMLEVLERELLKDKQ